jgi:amino acid adenylation domain-containing protein/thioester reductase-like protein
MSIQNKKIKWFDMLKNKIIFSCYLIGDDHLLVQCAQIILEKGHKILGIISSLDAAHKIASAHHINYYVSLDSATNSLLTTDYDYLFSIINGSILPATILQRARLLSINFHNAPLPQYAGVHALSWAILNDETQYGVTWHTMTEVIDGGDLLKQAHFPVDPHETALSLSLKCYAHALTSFSELIDELSQNKWCRIQQDLTHSSYHSFKQKPAGNGWISWQVPARDIERTVRALNLGHYHHNRLASPKIQIETSIYIINRLHIINELSTQQPGTLIRIDANAWQISTETNLISLEQLSTLDGLPCSLDSLVQKHQLDVGNIIPSPTPQELHQYHTLSEQSVASELFWVRTLIDFKPETLPAQPQHNDPSVDDPLIAIAHYELSEKQIVQWEHKLPKSSHSIDVLLSSILIYLYRLGTKEHTGIWAYNLEEKNNMIKKAFFSSFIPFPLSFDNTMSFYAVIESIQKTRCVIEKKEPFQTDVFYRYPELNQVEHQKYPLAFCISTTNQYTETIEKNEASILLVLYPEINKVTWFIKNNLIDKEPNLVTFIKDSTRYLSHLFNTLPSTLNSPISKLPVMDDKDMSKIINTWNSTTSNYPKNDTIIQLFEEQVRRTPNNTAVIYGTKSLSYSELNQKANQLARYLRKKGLAPNALAAICTTQELHLIIGILAILKTGAAYIPVDASYPKQHIHCVLEDSRPTLFLASPHLNERIKQECANLNIPILLFDTLVDKMEHESKENLQQVNISAKSRAYVIYTSGTTGKPKGVMVPHQGVNRLVKNTNYIRITEWDHMAQAASISFDAATFELWGALLNGATLVAVPQATLLDPNKFAAFLEKKGITILWLTSALFNQYASNNPSMFRHLTYLLVGGDVLNKERIMSVLECKQGAPKILLNGYGPTENTTFTTTYHITKEDKKLESIPIGKPIANSTVYILDELLQPTPVGGIGELYTGGDGVALGYLNRPDLNEQKFIRNPFSLNEDSMLYKTGDAVRWMPDGCIEYLGRQDNQVKIRGFRVELEAIQTHLAHHRAINQCCVRAEHSDKHAKVLVAYIVCKEEIGDKDLQVFLSNQLPAYMIPSFFIRMDKMPLTANGKVYYKKLPKPDFSKAASTKEHFTAPSTPIEHSLAAMWCSLLGCTTVGINDNFFDLGGHSLLITQLILKIKDLYKTELPLHEFLENPTIKHLNQLINGDKKTTSATENHQKMLTDRFLPQEIQVKGTYHKSTEPKHILLTGASGFLGAHLLFDLYHASKATIHCLIRAENEHEATARLNATLNKYQLDLQCNSRVKPLLGDLTQPLIGLSPAQFDNLSNSIDIIVHNGAAVNHLYNYELLRAANVNSTLDIIRLATQNKAKSIHYISTLSAASHFIDGSNCIIEDLMDAQKEIRPPSDGYSQTKWVSEQLLAEGFRQGLSINIYRPGWIVGQTKTGAINAESNHLLMLLKGCIQLQVAPKWEMALDMLPVDTLSKIIIDTALHSNQYGTVFNLINPNKLSWTHLIQYINQRGYSVSLIDPILWKEEHLKFINKDNALYSLYPLYINTPQGDWMKGLSTISNANNYNTSKAFDEMGQLAPTINTSLLDTYFGYLERQGFLTPRPYGAI